MSLRGFLIRVQPGSAERPLGPACPPCAQAPAQAQPEAGLSQSQAGVPGALQQHSAVTCTNFPEQQTLTLTEPRAGAWGCLGPLTGKVTSNQLHFLLKRALCNHHMSNTAVGEITKAERLHSLGESLTFRWRFCLFCVYILVAVGHLTLATKVRPCPLGPPHPHPCSCLGHCECNPGKNASRITSSDSLLQAFLTC